MSETLKAAGITVTVDRATDIDGEPLILTSIDGEEAELVCVVEDAERERAEKEVLVEAIYARARKSTLEEVKGWTEGGCPPECGEGVGYMVEMLDAALLEGVGITP